MSLGHPKFYQHETLCERPAFTKGHVLPRAQFRHDQGGSPGTMDGE